MIKIIIRNYIDDKSLREYTRIINLNMRVCWNVNWQITMYINSKYILSTKFNDDIFRNDNFKNLLIVVTIDELHFVNDWREFRKKFNEFHVLRNRLSIDISYFDVSVTLNANILTMIKKNVEFNNDCRLLKTTIDRSEINIHVVFIEND